MEVGDSYKYRPTETILCVVRPKFCQFCGVGNLACSRLFRRLFWTCASLRSPQRRLKAGGWSFYIFSGCGSADELFFGNFDLEFFQEFGVVGHFRSEEHTSELQSLRHLV